MLYGIIGERYSRDIIYKEELPVLQVFVLFYFFVLLFSEAEYSHQLLKPLIPVRSVQGFKPAGWLAKVCMARTNIEFPANVTGNEQETRVTQLLKEVKRVSREGHAKE